MIDASTKSTEAHHAVTYKGVNNQVTVGRGEPVRVNLSIGVNSPSKQAFKTEQTKITKILNHCRKPDLMMDLSIFATNPELGKFYGTSLAAQ